MEEGKSIVSKNNKAPALAEALLFYLVPEDGLEPSRSKATDFESVVYTNFTTRASADYYTYT